MGALQNFKSLEDGGPKNGQAFADGGGFAWEIDNKTRSSHPCRTTTEDAGGGNGESFGTHDLTESGEFLFDHGSGGFGHHVTAGGARATGGDDEMAMLLVA